MGSLSSSFSNINAIIPPHLSSTTTPLIPPSPPMIPILTSTPISMPHTPIDLTPIPPDEELPYAFSESLRGPVLLIHTVSLSDGSWER